MHQKCLIAIGLRLVVGTAAIGLPLAISYYIRKSKKKSGDGEDRSTTSSAGGGASAYETKKAVDEYLQFHFAHGEEILPYPQGPTEALNFTGRIAVLAEMYCDALKDFTGENPDPIALDLGCAVGGATFELARSFPRVLGIDYSQHFVNAAQALKEDGQMRYSVLEEGELTVTRTATVDPEIDRTRVKFVQGDACNLDPNLAKFDAVLAANLLCRLPDPRVFLKALSELVAPGGVAVLVSPYSWLEGWTPKEKWVGGVLKDGKPVRSAEAVKSILEKDFELVHEENVPFLIREHVRKYQWGISHATIWKKKQ